MAIGKTTRRLVRRLLLWLVAMLEEESASQNAVAGGPPADWLERVRRGAPQLLNPPEEQQHAAPPRREPQFAPPPKSRGPEAGSPPKPRRTRAIVEEELVARRLRTVPRLRPIVAREAAVPERDEDELVHFHEAEGTSAFHKALAEACVVEDEPIAPQRRSGEQAIPPVRKNARASEEQGPAILSVPKANSATKAQRRALLHGPKTIAVAEVQGRTAEEQRQTLVPVRKNVVATEEQRQAGLPALHLGTDVPGMQPHDEIRGRVVWPQPGTIANRETARPRDRATAPPRLERRWPDLAPVATYAAATHEVREAEEPAIELHAAPAGQQVDARRWPELPPLPQFGLGAIESLDDSDRLRRIDREQRGSAWSE